MRMIGLGVTVILSLCAARLWRQRAGGGKDAGGAGLVMGTGFFTAAFYLDSIFLQITEQASGEIAVLLPGEMWGWIVPGIGLFVSKGILAALLLALAAQNRPERGPLCADTSREKGEWEYLDMLTLGINLFFLLLAVRDGVWARQQGESAPGTRPGSGPGTVLPQALLLAVLLAYYISLYLHGRKQRLRRQRAEEEVRKREADIYLESAENQYQRTRELWHDLRNHINLLRLLLQEKKYDQMADYLRIFGADVESLGLPVKSGNPVVDALLADKTARAKRDGVRVELSLCDLSQLRLRPDEICGLLGNLLDNALEANRRVESGRFLTVTCENREEYCYIRICNAAESGAESRVGSEKKDRRNQVGHGLGLRSAQRIAHGCGGELAVEQREGCFTAVVRLPGRLACVESPGKRA